ncbi:hypothetical protein CYLTODRAFT_446100, partial [Cylindrobasidium torrendii FP15055 ss-10]
MLVRGYLVSFDDAARIFGHPAPEKEFDRIVVGSDLIQHIRSRNGSEELVRWPDYHPISSLAALLVVTEYEEYSKYRFIDLDKYDQSKLPQREENDNDRRIKTVVFEGMDVGELPFVTCYRDDELITPRELISEDCIVNNT